MGYYTMVVPNTALAKDAGGLHLSQGWAYLTDFVVAVPVVGHRGVGDRGRSCSRRSPAATGAVALATGAMLAAALVDVLYIVAIGGDYMHGRLLLPAFFALGLPASMVLRRDTAMPRDRRAGGGVGPRERGVVPAAAASTGDGPRAGARSPTGARCRARR